jgi:hypothetical protein
MNFLSIDNPYGLITEIIMAAALALFLFGRRSRKKTADPRQLLRIELKLSTTLQPSEIRIPVDQPAQLIIHRYEADPAEELFEIEALDIYELLPALHSTVISINPLKRGKFPIVIAGEKAVGTLIVE